MSFDAMTILVIAMAAAVGAENKVLVFLLALASPFVIALSYLAIGDSAATGGAWG